MRSYAAAWWAPNPVLLVSLKGDGHMKIETQEEGLVKAEDWVLHLQTKEHQ